jgi:hypothetical protein
MIASGKRVVLQGDRNKQVCGNNNGQLQTAEGDSLEAVTATGCCYWGESKTDSKEVDWIEKMGSRFELRKS